MDKDLTLAALREGEMRLEGQFVYGSNHTFLAICTIADLEIKAVYKPMQGERPLWDFPIKTLARREVAAYMVSEALGWELVPPTIFRLKGAPMGPGSVQFFIEHDPNLHFFTFKKKKKTQFQKVMAFDLLINNADRKGGHFLLDANGKLWLIDHGVSFHEEDKLRTVLWDFAGQAIPQKIIDDVHAIIPYLSPENELYQSLQPHLLPQEIQALKTRSEELVKNGIFPLPPEERRAYPWPLV
ncbi:MAG TPA: hypothetical protein DCL08_04725 [Anaerolineaceae bacterium]|nr:hypothetical protein [Anaerolineaceae bacterium]